MSTLIQPSRPYAVILAAVLHFFPLGAARRIITEFAGLAPSGSYLIISVLNGKRPVGEGGRVNLRRGQARRASP